ncbi:MAG: gshB [Gammaproteobacteria bacterium]|jgi:glutathione synthase|nr:gshB [Gammaproteobacteria bacterium]
MTIQLGVVMDPIQAINYKKDSTLAMLWEAAARGWTLHYFEQADLFVREGRACANSRLLNVFRDPQHWFELGAYHCIELATLDIILLRKDPPFNLEYIYTTYILELAEQAGVKVINKPQSLRDANEKFYTTWFPQYCPPTLITRDIALLRAFLKEQKDIICKPLNGMGGISVFRVEESDLNASVIFETLTRQSKSFMMAQSYIPEITQGDKRILLINGEPVAYALARLPAAGELRGNLAAGAKGVAQPLSEQDKALCRGIGPALREKGLFFVGLDVIGHYLTEINVTSPTCIRELDEQCDLNISHQLFNQVLSLL